MNRTMSITLTGAAITAVGLTAVASFSAWSGNRCSSLGEADRARLIAFIHTKYKLPASIQVGVVPDTGPVSGSCFHSLVFAADNGRRPFRVELFASPDFRFLTSDLLDAKADPKEAQRQQREMAAGLVRGNLPTIGPEKAPATLVVFSDFQCPYCARMAKILNELTASETDRIRVVYHYFPLPMHRWARPAAEAAACAQEQGIQAFWSLHDFLFAHQGELSVDNLQRRVTAQAQTIPSLDGEKFETCLKEHRTSGQIEQDMAFGKETGVHATPTLFLNGEQIDNVSAEQLHTLIHQLTGNPNSAVPESTAEGSPAPAREAVR